jgi:hypothetical protein
MSEKFICGLLRANNLLGIFGDDPMWIGVVGAVNCFRANAQPRMRSERLKPAQP